MGSLTGRLEAAYYGYKIPKRIQIINLKQKGVLWKTN